MELVKSKEMCCGCRTCEHVCPKSAITMQPDEQGFLYPVIDQEKCVDCGLCKKNCAFQNGYEKRMEFEPCLGYAARHRDEKIMMKSRSGGAFTAITDLILKNGGVVYGAGYDEKEGFFKIVHKRAENEEQRNEFRGSKYVQSDLGDVFVQIKKDLTDGRQVVFSGTGCQAGALHTYLGREYDNLLIMDIVCHGAPSPKLWRDFLDMKQREAEGRVTAVDFRNKNRFGWKTHRETISIDGKQLSSKLYSKIFIKDLMNRPSCYHCIYTNRNRVGDITIADFWGHEKAVPGFGEDDRGVSLVMVNTEKGKKIWEQARVSMDVIECTGYPYRHMNMKRPTPKPEQYDAFWEDYLTHGFDYIMEKYCGHTVTETKQKMPSAHSAAKQLDKTNPLQKIKQKLKKFLRG